MRFLEFDLNSRFLCPEIVGTTAALIAAGIAAAAGGVGSSLIGSSAAKSAANTQATAAQAATAEQQREFDTTQANEAPWLQSGQVSLNQLMTGLAPGGNLSTPFAGTFTPPTLDEAKATPGYQFAQEEGEQGIEHGAAASGGAFTTGTLANLAGFNNNLAQNAYQQAYTNAQNTFGTQFNTYNTNQSNLYNKLASSSGLGQTTATQLGQIGQTTAASIGNNITGAGAAQAAGTVGSANAITSGLTGTVNNILGQISLQQLMNGNASSIPAFNPAVSSQLGLTGSAPTTFSGTP